jgi:hypothetical protein
MEHQGCCYSNRIVTARDESLKNRGEGAVNFVSCFARRKKCCRGGAAWSIAVAEASASPAWRKKQHFGVIHVICKRVLNVVLTSSDSRPGIRLFYQWKSDRDGEGGITLPASAAIMLPAYRCCLHALEALEARAVERVRISSARKRRMWRKRAIC